MNVNVQSAQRDIPVYSNDTAMHEKCINNLYLYKMGFEVKPTDNLDKAWKSGQHYFAKNRDTKRRVHVGITMMRSLKCYVLVKMEETSPDEPSLCWATIISDREAYDLIIGAGKADLLKSAKFSRLLQFLNNGGTVKPWSSAERWERVKWTPAQLAEIKRRHKYTKRERRVTEGA